jgi:hypothetical protein
MLEFRSVTNCQVALQTRLESAVKLFERPIDRLAFRLLFRGVFSFPENMRSTTLEVYDEGRIRRPAIIDDCYREVLVENSLKTVLLRLFMTVYSV